MTKRIDKKKEDSGFAKSIAIGTLIGMLTLVALFTIGAILILNGKIPEEGIGATSCIVVGISTMSGCILSNTKGKNSPFMNCGGTILGMILILTGCNIFFFDGRFDGLWGTIGSALLGGMLAGLFAIKKQPKRKKHSR